MSLTINNGYSDFLYRKYAPIKNNPCDSILFGANAKPFKFEFQFPFQDFTSKFSGVKAEESVDYCAQIKKNAKIGKNGKGESADIENLDERTQKAVLNIIEYAKKIGYTVEIRTAKRSVAEQKRLLATNPYAAKVENSHHVIGDAVDLHFWDKNGKKAPMEVYYEIGEYAESKLGMRYGNNVKKNKEYWHFDFGKSREDIKLP
ncbi:hypothetical protein J6E39_04265 [bacterium]|nr:hypothetical protein [bacterium]